MPKSTEKWYQNWFNSPYYHILYNNRNQEEAEHFIDNLFAYLQPNRNERVLDAACGRGRHSIYINKKGYDVTGIDISEENVDFATSFEKKQLHFLKHDMRVLFYVNYFDIVLNLFTSFGYFEKEHDNLLALQTFAKSLKRNGKFVIDFLNAHKVKKNLVVKETIEKDKIPFYISRRTEGNSIVKEIRFEHRGKHFAYKEKVRALTLEDFKTYFAKTGFTIDDIFGDYALNDFIPEKSDRLILICSKK